MTEIDYQNHPDPWGLLNSQPGFVEEMRTARRQAVQAFRGLGISPENIPSGPEYLVRGLWHARLAEDLSKLQEIRRAISEKA